MKNLNTISEDLFNKIRGRFPNLTIGDQNGNIVTEPASARFFDFEYKEDGTSLGTISISLSEDDGISIIYSRDFINDQDNTTQKNWYNFLKELREFAKKRLLNFDVRDINKTNLTKRDYKFLANRSGDNNMNETKLYGTSRISYQKIGEARIMIKHTESVNQESATGRTQKIGKIYIESSDGERFRYPYKHLSGARAMARHVSEGGNVYDDFGKHIVSLSEEMNKLRKFKSYMGRSAVMAESLAGYTDIVKERIATVKKTIESLQKPAYYKETFEAFETPVMEDVPSDVAENWIDELTIKQFNEELQDIFPYIYNLVKEGTKAVELGPEELVDEASKGIEAMKKAGNAKADAEAKERVKKDKSVEESGLQYYTGVKKHGKEYMKKAAQAGREGASQEELGRLKDKYSKAAKTKEEIELGPDDLIAEGPFKGVGKTLMKRKLDKQYKKSDLANFDKSGIDTSGKTPDEIGQMKSDYYHSHMDKADKAKKAKNRLSREEIELEQGFEEMMGQFSDTVCEECGNQSWTTLEMTEEEIEEACSSMKKKKKNESDVEEGERHGNSKIYDKCWKGYRKVPGKKAGEAGSCKKVESEEEVSEAYINTSKDAIEVLGALRGMGKKIERGQDDDQGNLANAYVGDVWDVYSFIEARTNGFSGLDKNAKAAIDAMMKLRGEAKKLETKPGSGLNARFGNAIVTVLYPVMEYLNTTDFDRNKKEDDTDEGNAYAHAVKKAKMNGKKKGDKIDGPDGDEITLEKDEKTPLGEFILSYYDRETGKFPKGETAILTMVEKDYGEQFIEPAKAFIESVNQTFEAFQMATPSVENTDEYNRMRELAGLR